jgi:hypothetical protein
VRHAPGEIGGLDMAGPVNRCAAARRGRLVILVALAAVVAFLSSCGSGGVNPSRSPTFSGLPSRSSAPASPPAGQTATRTHIATQTETRTQIATRTETRTAAPVRSAAAAPTSAKSSQAASEDTGSSTPAWVWWLVGAIVLAAVVVTVLALRRRSRRRAWADKFVATKRDVAVFARETIGQLEQAPTAQQIAGGWRIETARVVAIEDRLTRLEATAVNDADRTKARTLRDAVRASRARLAALETAEDMVVAVSLLRSAGTGLETALAAVDGPAQPSENETTLR